MVKRNKARKKRGGLTPGNGKETVSNITPIHKDRKKIMTIVIVTVLTLIVLT